MMDVWKRIDETARRFYTPWVDIPVHSLMVSGAQQALYAVINSLMDDDMERVKAGKRPRYQSLVDELQAEANRMLQADEERVKAKAATS